MVFQRILRPRRFGNDSMKQRAFRLVKPRLVLKHKAMSGGCKKANESFTTMVLKTGGVVTVHPKVHQLAIRVDQIVKCSTTLEHRTMPALVNAAIQTVTAAVLWKLATMSLWHTVKLMKVRLNRLKSLISTTALDWNALPQLNLVILMSSRSASCGQL